MCYTLNENGYRLNPYSELTVDHSDDVLFPYVIALDGTAELNKRGVKDLISILIKLL